MRIGHLDFSPPPAAPRKAAGASTSGAFAPPRRDRADIGAIPAQPPVDTLREVDRAAARAEELWSEKRELHFEPDQDSGRMIVQLRDLDGNVLRTIPPSEALRILSDRSL